MSFKKFAGIIQILLSLILVAIPTAGLILIKGYNTKIIQQLTALTPKEIIGTANLPLQDILLMTQYSMVFILIIFSIIALALFLQGIVNIREY